MGREGGVEGYSTHDAAPRAEDLRSPQDLHAGRTLSEYRRGLRTGRSTGRDSCCHPCPPPPLPPPPPEDARGTAPCDRSAMTQIRLTCSSLSMTSPCSQPAASAPARPSPSARRFFVLGMNQLGRKSPTEGAPLPLEATAGPLIPNARSPTTPSNRRVLVPSGHDHHVFSWPRSWQLAPPCPRPVAVL